MMLSSRRVKVVSGGRSISFLRTPSLEKGDDVPHSKDVKGPDEKIGEGPLHSTVSTAKFEG